MALSRFFSQPNTLSSTSINGVVTDTSANGAGWNLGADSIQVPTIVTAPPNSASVFAPASYTAATASVATVVQNTLGYDAQFVAYFQGAASVASFLVGVGSSATPAMVTVAGPISSATVTAVESFSAYVPANYYFSWQVVQANGASVPSGALTIVANPV
jgi:hypothetical protein